MIKVLIVDDEETIRKGLCSVVPWEENGYKVIGTAKNGVEALDFFGHDYTDIVISDIKMPQMDGIELMQNVHIHYPNLPFIFISGYDEFQFVQKALNNGAFAYVLKPVDIDELMSLLNSAKQKLKLGSGDTILKRLIERNLFNADDAWDFSGFEYIQEEFKNDYFCAVNIRCRYNEIKSSSSNLNFFQITERTISKVLDHGNYALIDFTPWSVIYCIFNEDITKLKQSISHFINSLCESVDESYPTTFGVWTGGIYRGISHIVDSYFESFDDEAFKGMNRYDSEIDVEAESSSVDVLTDLFSCEDSIVSMLLIGNLDNAFTRLSEQKEQIKRKKLTAAEARPYLQSLLYKYLSALKKSGKELDVSNDLDFFKSAVFYTTDELFEHVFSVISHIASTITPMSISQTYLHIEKVKRYIEEHFSDPYLSLSDVAGFANLNPSYLSAEFTKSVGICFINYLTDLRMERAKVQLLSSNKKIIDVSFDVGYVNSTYFSTIFKKYTGMTPSEYRNQNPGSTKK